jgi:hypothetical protein
MLRKHHFWKWYYKLANLSQAGKLHGVCGYREEKMEERWKPDSTH